MLIASAFSQFSQHTAAIHALARGLTPEQARWKPTPADWSVVEVINHLCDEEREDFRAHLRAALFAPEGPWARIDPPGWVTARRYNERDLAESLANWLAEREQSLIWLRGLGAVNWANTIQAPWGPISAGDLLAAWVGHDVLHLRQLVELRWAIWSQAALPNTPRYAGDW
jgi:hypothetical protein